jgi:hypothetical protein
MLTVVISCDYYARFVSDTKWRSVCCFDKGVLNRDLKHGGVICSIGIISV